MLCCYRNQAQLGSGLNLTNASNMIEKWNQIDIMAHILWSHCLHNVPLDCGVDFKFRKVAILKDSWGCNYGIVKQSWLQWFEINSECVLSEVTLHPVICSGIKNTELTDILLALGVTFFHLQRGEKDKNSMYGGRLCHSKQNNNVCVFCVCSRRNTRLWPRSSPERSSAGSGHFSPENGTRMRMWIASTG